MPYINIREADITPVLNLDSVENAVLIFGFDFRRYLYANPTEDVEWQTLKSQIYGNRGYKLYTSLQEFLNDINNKIRGLSTFKTEMLSSFWNETVIRPYRTAYDCLLRGLPVIYVPVDDYISDNLVITYYGDDADGNRIELGKYVEYLFLSDSVPTGGYEGTYQGGTNIKHRVFTESE